MVRLPLVNVQFENNQRLDIPNIGETPNAPEIIQELFDHRIVNGIQNKPVEIENKMAIDYKDDTLNVMVSPDNGLFIHGVTDWYVFDLQYVPKEEKWFFLQGGLLQPELHSIKESTLRWFKDILDYMSIFNNPADHCHENHEHVEYMVDRVVNMIKNDYQRKTHEYDTRWTMTITPVHPGGEKMVEREINHNKWEILTRLLIDKLSDGEITFDEFVEHIKFDLGFGKSDNPNEILAHLIGRPWHELKLIKDKTNFYHVIQTLKLSVDNPQRIKITDGDIKEMNNDVFTSLSHIQVVFENISIVAKMEVEISKRYPANPFSTEYNVDITQICLM